MDNILSEESLIARAVEERTRIFERYDQGRTKLDDIDPWEDPSFEIYHKMDKYGFIHDERLPQPKVTFQSTANFDVQREREKKWNNMLQRWNSGRGANSGFTEKLVKRTYKGIPNHMRTVVWPKMLDVDASIASNPGVYRKQLAFARQWSTEVRQIDSDVNRQFREHMFYRERYSVKQQSLFNVLTAYSMYNMELGYCQGMAGVAGMLLMYMDEEPAFWALNTFMTDPKYAMHGLFIEGFPKLTRFLAHHDRIVAKFLPKLHRHFAKHTLDAILYSLKWFFVIFVERVPFSLCLRIWDIYMIEGERVVTAMAFTILRMHASRLLKMKDMDQMTDLLQTQLHRDFGFADDVVVRTLQQTMSDLRRVKMDLPPPPAANERPRRRLGEFVEPDYEAKMGLRKTMFTDTERRTTETIIMRQDSMPPDVISNYSYDNSDEQMACLILDDCGSSMRSSSIARTSIASNCTTSAATTTANTQNLDSCSWSEDTHSGSGAAEPDDDQPFGNADQVDANDDDDDIELNHEIFIKTANEFMLSPRCHSASLPVEPALNGGSVSVGP